MSEMVERVAMAIWNSRESRFPDRVQRRPDDLDRSSGVWGAVVADARAAIEAMREPTEAMVKAGYVADPLGYDVDDSDISMLYSRIYEGMINAALKD